MRRTLRVAGSWCCLALCSSNILLWIASHGSYTQVMLSTPDGRGVVLGNGYGRYWFNAIDGISQPSRWGVRSTSHFEGSHFKRYRKNLLSRYPSGGFYGRNKMVVPIWLPVLVSGVLVVVLRPSPRWRFNTRELLAVTTLLAVLAAGIPAVLKLADNDGQ